MTYSRSTGVRACIARTRHSSSASQVARPAKGRVTMRRKRGAAYPTGWQMMH
mgnify:CR=1 FL=1